MRSGYSPNESGREARRRMAGIHVDGAAPCLKQRPRPIRAISPRLLEAHDTCLGLEWLWRTSLGQLCQRRNELHSLAVGLTALHPYGHLSHLRVFIPSETMKKVWWSGQV